VANTAESTAETRKLVFLDAAEDDGTASALRCRQGGTDVFGSEVLAIVSN
jgi:hypothetical protein